MAIGVAANTPDEWRALARAMATALNGLHFLTPGDTVTIDKDHAGTIYHLLSQAEPPDAAVFPATAPRAP